MKSGVSSQVHRVLGYRSSVRRGFAMTCCATTFAQLCSFSTKSEAFICDVELQVMNYGFLVLRLDQNLH